MQKVITTQVLKPMVLVLKSKFNTKVERRVKEIIQKNDAQSKFFKKQILDPVKVKREVSSDFGFNSERIFINELEVCLKHTGDVLLDARELQLLYYLYELEL